METNTNNSNDCLYECKELMRTHMASSSLSLKCEDIINALTCEIDVDKFKAWFDRNIYTFKNKDNPTSYIKKSFLIELDKGTFNIEEQPVVTTEKKYVSVNCHDIIVAFRNKGIAITQDDTMYMSILWTELLNAGVSETQAKELNHQILIYMKYGQEFKDYVQLIKKSNTLKPFNVDWKKIEEESKLHNDHWNAIMKELNEYEGNDNDEDSMSWREIMNTLNPKEGEQL